MSAHIDTEGVYNRFDVSTCLNQEVAIAMPPQEAEDFRESLLTGGVGEACDSA